MRTVEAQGYSKQKAFEATELDTTLDMFKNATLAWKKAGAPLDNKKLKAFLASYIKDKKAAGVYLVIEAASDDSRLRPYNVINEITNGKRKATTVYQIKEAEIAVKYTKDIKTVTNKETGEETEVEFQNPYKTEIIQVDAKDEEGKVIKNEDGTTEKVDKEIQVANVVVKAVGAVEGTAPRKDSALKLMKELIQENKKDYVVEIVKEITDGQKYAGYGLYTPSKSAKEGKFLFAVNE